MNRRATDRELIETFKKLEKQFQDDVIEAIGVEDVKVLNEMTMGERTVEGRITGRLLSFISERIIKQQMMIDAIAERLQR